MSHTAHIRSHRKPRNRNASTIAMRAGVAGGVLSLAAAGASATANAAEPVTQTLELPTLTADLATQAAQSADATQQMAADYQLQAERDAAAEAAAKQADKDLAKAKKEEARKKAAEEAERKAAAERASRDSTRTTLTTNSASTAPPASGSVETVISFLEAQLGDAYVFGSNGPDSWDCSSLVQAAYRSAGVSIPRVTYDQAKIGRGVSRGEVAPGDLIIYYSGQSHVAMAVDNVRAVHASTEGIPVKVANIDSIGPISVIRRVVG